MLTLQGSPLSWEEVLDRYSPLVFRLSWQSLGNRQDAEDAAQEVFVALVRSSPAFRDETHLRAWLIRATSHRCKNLAASAWKRHTVPLDPDWTPPAGAPPRPVRCSPPWAGCRRSTAPPYTSTMWRGTRRRRSPPCWAVPEARCSPGSCGPENCSATC